jgi:uncharacterized protein YrrD
MIQFDLNINAIVHSQDGPSGKLVGVVTDPDTQQVTELIIQKGFLPAKKHILPFSVVEKATKEGVFLSISHEVVETYPEYKVVDYEMPAPDVQPTSYQMADGTRVNAPIPTVRRRIRKGIEAGREVIERGVPVRNSAERLGTIDHCIVDGESDEITHLVLRQGLLFPTHPVIPFLLVQEVTSNGIFVNISKEKLETLPQYSPPVEADILAQFNDRLHAAPFDTGQVNMSLENGVAYLSGVVPDEASKREVEFLAHTTPGVVDVENGLSVANDNGAHSNHVMQVGEALAADPRTGDAVIEVINVNGVITLAGTVQDTSVKQAAEEIARSQPGVISVINALRLKQR